MNHSSISKMAAAVLVTTVALTDAAFTPTPTSSSTTASMRQLNMPTSLNALEDNYENRNGIQQALTTVVATLTIAASSFLLGGTDAAWAENELNDKYGSGINTELVDQTCLVDHCQLQAKACLADDPSCRKGLTCTAKCLGDNTCITGCMARYGNDNLDNLLKCTIEDHECIKVAILPGGADEFGSEPKAPGPTVVNFEKDSLSGSWYKVIGFNPNYDCYACQRNTFHKPQMEVTDASWWGPSQADDKLEVDVEFSMARLMPDGSPLPPSGKRETIGLNNGMFKGAQSIGYNEYSTHEVMVFDQADTKISDLVLGKKGDDTSYSRTAHSEGEMFGLKFWENWYVIGENDPGQEEFKFIYYNGKTRQNTYNGAFIYSRTKEMSPANLEKVYSIAENAGLKPQNFCKIQNGCFDDSPSGRINKQGADYPFRGILASTKVSQFFGVQPVVAEGGDPTPATKRLPSIDPSLEMNRAWWYKVGDYFENPNRHFKAIESELQIMDWPDYIVNKKSETTDDQ